MFAILYVFSFLCPRVLRMFRSPQRKSCPRLLPKHTVNLPFHNLWFRSLFVNRFLKGHYHENSRCGLHHQGDGIDQNQVLLATGRHRIGMWSVIEKIKMNSFRPLPIYIMNKNLPKFLAFYLQNKRNFLKTLTVPRRTPICLYNKTFLW
jgi:hypothetical protein